MMLIQPGKRLSRQNIKQYIRLVTVLLLSLATSPANSNAGSSAAPEKLSPAEITQIINTRATDLNYGGLMISSSERVSGPVVIINGALDIQPGGVLLGDAWVINGSLVLTGDAIVSGKVNLVNSKCFFSQAARITGGVDYYQCECVFDAITFETTGQITFIQDDDPRAVKTSIALTSGRGNRADYSLIGFGLTRLNEKHPRPYIKGHLFYYLPLPKKINNSPVSFDLDLAIPLSGGNWDFLIKGFSRAFTNDSWQLPESENDFIVCVTGDDYFDYWDRRGGEIGLRYNRSAKSWCSLSLSLQEERSIEANKIAALFRLKEKRFRPNPFIDNGQRLAAALDYRLDGRLDDIWRQSAWCLNLRLEKGFSAGPWEFDYITFDLDLSRYNFLPWNMRFDWRAKLFSAYKTIPAQMTQTLTGYAGVRGTNDFPFSTPRSDRLALFSAELRKGLPELPLFSFLFADWDLVAFTDIGLLVDAVNKQAPLAFLDTPFDQWRQTVGLGISGESFLPYIGFYVAQDLDRSDFEPRYILRFQRSF